MLEVKRIEQFDEWNRFVVSKPHAQFMQSELYMNFCNALGEDAFVAGVYKAGVLIGGSVVSGVRARRGSYLVLPYGPLLDFEDREVSTIFFDYIRKYAVENTYDFIRFSPFVPDSTELRGHVDTLQARRAPTHILAENTWLLKLDSDEDTLLAQMNKNHRNLIRRCHREGVEVRMTTDHEALSRLNDMHDEVAKRHSFKRFSRSFIEKEFHTFSREGRAVIFEARLPDGEVDSSAIVVFFGDTASYRHSASLGLNKKLPTSYAIQWHVVQEAKRQGKTWYNFWGIAPKNTGKTHPFSGITHFKRGFGGQQLDLLPCHDIPVRRRYIMTRWFELMRAKMRGF